MHKSAADIVLTEKKQAFILENYQSKSVAKMAAEMGIGDRFIYKFLSDRDLPTFDKRKKRISRENGIYFDESARLNWLV